MPLHELTIPGIRLDRTFDCGQAFRFVPCNEGFKGIALNKPLSLCQEGDALMLECPESDLAFWENYFDVGCDYAPLMNLFETDPQLFPCCEHSAGIRILRQPPFETLITFIISANNHVPRIRSIIERICARYGEDVGGAFAFPTPEALAGATVDELTDCGTGYRAPYIIKTAQLIADGFDLDALSLLPEPEARKALTELPGVGPKVAQCVMLFGLGFTGAFPVDVWIKRVLKWLYPDLSEADAVASCAERFGALAGVAQQLLFHYARQVKLCKNR